MTGLCYLARLRADFTEISNMWGEERAIIFPEYVMMVKRGLLNGL